VSEIQVQKAPVKAPLGLLSNYIRIQLEDNDEIPPTGQFFGINGKGYMLKTGIPVDVPAALVDILDHAVQSQPIINPDNRRVMGYRDRLRFPYRVITKTRE
jgi:hypothetical protein